MRNLVFVFMLCGTLRAEFSYTQTAQMTGGAMFNMMKSLGPLAKGAREPIVTTQMFKGNKMASVGKDTVTITDLDAETITTIRTDKKTYSVVTFAQMKQAMDDAMAKAQSRSKDKAEANKADVNFKVSAKATGQTKAVNGLNAKEIVMTMTAEGTDQKTGNTGAMDISIDSWMAAVPGYEEVKAFQRRMGEKMGYLFGSGMSQIGQMQPQTLKGFAQVSEEMAKVEGVPVEQVMKMGGSATGDGSPAQASPAQPSQQTQQQPTSLGGAVAAGALGRFGGFGRKSSKTSDAPPAQAQQDSASGSLIEMTTSLTGFGSGKVDASKFEIPAGFKQTENDLVKRGR